MSIRLRTVHGVRVAICAARSVPQPGDVYLDDADHHALAQKFAEDFKSEDIDIPDALVDASEASLRAIEESNNPARDWWNRTYTIGTTARGVL